MFAVRRQYGLKTDKYYFDQTNETVTAHIPLKSDHPLRGKDVIVDLTATSLLIQIKGQPEPVVNGKFPHPIRLDESQWFLESDTQRIVLELYKPKESVWWPSLIVGDAEIDVDLIEGSKYLDDSLLKKVKAAKQQRKLEEQAGKQGSSSSS